MSAKCSSYMHGTPYIFHFVHPLVKTAKIMAQRVNFLGNLKNICPATVNAYNLMFSHVNASKDIAFRCSFASPSNSHLISHSLSIDES